MRRMWGWCRTCIGTVRAWRCRHNFPTQIATNVNIHTYCCVLVGIYIYITGPGRPEWLFHMRPDMSGYFPLMNKGNIKILHFLFTLVYNINTITTMQKPETSGSGNLFSSHCMCAQWGSHTHTAVSVEDCADPSVWEGCTMSDDAKMEIRKQYQKSPESRGNTETSALIQPEQESAWPHTPAAQHGGLLSYILAISLLFTLLFICCHNNYSLL